MSVVNPVAVDVSVTATMTGRRRAMRRLIRDIPTMIAAGILALLMLIATVGAPVVSAVTGHSIPTPRTRRRWGS